jgi:hypothetical protein
MLAMLRVAPLLPSPTLRAVAWMMPGRDGKADSLIKLESWLAWPLTACARDAFLLRLAEAFSLRR